MEQAELEKRFEKLDKQVTELHRLYKELEKRVTKLDTRPMGEKRPIGG